MALTNLLVIGNDTTSPLYSIGNDDIVSLKVSKANNIVNEELSIDTLEAEFYYTEQTVTTIYRGSDYSTSGEYFVTFDGLIPADGVVDAPSVQAPYGTQVSWYVNGAAKDIYFVSEVKRIGRSKYRLYAVSFVGILDGCTHQGGVWGSASFSTIAASILSSSVTGMTINRSFASNLPTVTGHLPYDSARNNLYRLLLASGVKMTRRCSGTPLKLTVVFDFMNSNTVTKIEDDSIYDAGSETNPTGISSVEVTEHYFEIQATTQTTLFETDTSVDHQLVLFEEPCAGYLLGCSETMTINSYSENHAIVTGYGELYGYPYIHTTAINAITDASAAVNKVVSVTDNELINSVNSDAVKKRLYNYYKSGKTIENAIATAADVLTTGGMYKFLSPFGDYVTAFLSKVDANVSGNIKNGCEFISGYNPNNAGGVYTQTAILTGSGTYSFPASATFAKVILVAGGSGGEDGTDGADGEVGRCVNGTIKREGDGGGGEGGAGGAGGAGGKHYILEIDSLPASSSFTYSCGTGGARYAHGGTATSGTDTTIVYNATTYTTASGSVGIVANTLNSQTYANNGADGYDGGSGGQTYEQPLTIGLDAYRFISSPGYDVEGASGAGLGGNSGPKDQTGVVSVSAGNGGGGAYGTKGSFNPGYEYMGGGGITIVEGKKYPYISIAYGGDGGDGGNAAAAAAAGNYGNGGSGGHGGGGGGAGGGIWCENASTSSRVSCYGGLGGEGGTGSAGTAGADGCVIVMY